MQQTPSGWVRDVAVSRGNELPRQRWAWTYQYGKPLLLASVVAVVLSGSGLLVAVNTIGDGDDVPVDPTASPTLAASATPAAGPTQSSGTSTVTGPECVVGTWRTVELEEDLTTGILTADDPVTFTYAGDGTATVDYGDLTRFTFEDTIFGGNSAPTPAEIEGTVTYEYQADATQISYTFPPTTNADINIPDFPGGGLNLTYTPSVVAFGYECTGDTMTHQADDVDYRAVLERAT